MNFIEMTEKLNDFEDLKISTNLNARNIFSMNIGVFARRPHWTPNTKFIFSSKIIPNWKTDSDYIITGVSKTNYEVYPADDIEDQLAEDWVVCKVGIDGKVYKFE